jgi:hypothetical protein
MKTILRVLCMGFIASLLLSACSVQKRQYMSGYHVSWKKNKAKFDPNSEKITLKKVKQKDQAVVATVETPEVKKDEGLTASSSKDEVTLQKTEEKPLIGTSTKENSVKNHVKKEVKKMIKPFTNLKAGRFNGFALASMILGILALISYYGAFVLGVLAVIFGIIALRRIRENPEMGGRGMAIAGLVCGIVALVIMTIVVASVASAPIWR